ncbi:hypothetical protein SUGI_0626870 [Cryptomeria japonica]|nr:hypothetical protein SUGI_0626870 [Cryptomeria japonica]
MAAGHFVRCVAIAHRLRGGKCILFFFDLYYSSVFKLFSSYVVNHLHDMGNIIPSHSSPPLSHSNSSCHYTVVPPIAYDVFINHCGKDTKHSLSSSMYDSLQNRGFKVFLDKNSVRVGQYIPEAIVCAIRRAGVHIVILSPNYAESEWCLDELYLLIQTGAPIIPVLWKVRPSEVRMEEKDGVYAKAFRKHNKAGKFSTSTLDKWKSALPSVSLIRARRDGGENHSVRGSIY